MSSIPVLGREVIEVVDGRAWKIARLEIDVLDRFIDWIRSELPPCEPFAGFDKIIPHLPPEEALKLISQEKDRRDSYAVIDFTSPLVDKYLKTARGMIHLLWFMLQVHQPEATINDAMKVFRNVGPARIMQLLKMARGEYLQGKAEAPAAPESGQTGAESAGV